MERLQQMRDREREREGGRRDGLALQIVCGGEGVVEEVGGLVLQDAAGLYPSSERGSQGSAFPSSSSGLGEATGTARLGQEQRINQRLPTELATEDTEEESSEEDLLGIRTHSYRRRRGFIAPQVPNLHPDSHESPDSSPPTIPDLPGCSSLPVVPGFLPPPILPAPPGLYSLLPPPVFPMAHPVTANSIHSKRRQSSHPWFDPPPAATASTFPGSLSEEPNPDLHPAHEAQAYQHDIFVFSGELEFSLTYYEDQQALHCTVIRAKDLQATEHTGYADPYVLVHLLPRAARVRDHTCHAFWRMQSKYVKGGEMRTRTVHRTLHPEFNETVTYHGIRPEDLVVKSLQLSVNDDTLRSTDEDRFGHDNLGEVIQPLNVLQPQVPFHTIAKLDLPHWMERNSISGLLQKMARKGSMDPVGMDPSVERGKILLSLKFSSSRHALIVGIIRCKGLFPKDINGYSDPFVRVCVSFLNLYPPTKCQTSLLPDPQHRRYKTTTKHKNLNPTFNEEFIFDGKLSDLPKRTLDISVWDKDYGRRDDFLGSLRIGIESKGERLRHWFETIKNPDIRHDRWHALTGDFIPDT
ncbi:unnamed protein product [Darwinula stevensoni]|uniref:C2 domain-containing protein n=1 Tax=Darwinula stevensoni TaxID=69355 RepID=A0A7R8XCA2_9CRUS|nr:unnamed protein product [Darwinula stevensoni]CAG0891959.1 unnamed protein product [Darwinula stevensoni]